MNENLRVLIVEDSEDDALLMVRHLTRAGFDVDCRRVETAAALQEALSEAEWDVILCDYSLPGFGGLAAIAVVREVRPDLPLILVSGRIGEDTAVQAMKAGAYDYIMKDSLTRLVPAIRREMREAAARRDRRRMEGDLAASEEKFQRIFHSSPVAMALSTVEDGTILDVNGEYLNLTEYSREELVGKRVRDLGLWADPAERTRILDEVKRKKRVTGAPASVRTKSGRIVRVLFSADIVEIAGAPCLLSSALDVTDIRRAEDALRASEKRLSEIIDFFPDATLVIDRGGRVVAWNRAMEAMTGVPAKDMIGKGDYEYALPFYGERRPILVDLALHPRPDMEPFYTGIYRKGDVLYGESFVPGLPGGEAHLSATASVLRDERGEATGAIECIRDNTDRKKAQEELREAEKRYRGIFEDAQEGIFRSTLDGRLILANPALARIFGFESPEELTEAITDVRRQLFVDPAERAAVRIILEEKGVVAGREVDMYRKGGRHFWASLTMRTVYDPQGNALHYEGLIEDITDRKLSTERMRKALGATVHAIAASVEARDPYTAGHQKRVADLARSIAAEMGLAAERIDGIRTASIIHDLGKIAVPAEILSKPTQLTRIEFELIKVHPQAGHDILKDIEFPWPVARMVLEHHERMDGSGYPRGLSGGETLLESRILQVADVVESMASYRPYRPSLGLEPALEEISKNRAILYDPEVVDACLRLFRVRNYRLDAP